MTRLDWLENQLENDNLSAVLRTKYEQEANRLAEQMTQNKEQARLRNIRLQEEKEKLDIEAVDASLRDIAVKVAGEEWATWLEKALKLYRVTDGFTVVSIAHGPDKEEQWECDSMLIAKQKILQLIRYKYRDHFERGHKFAYDPDEVES